MLCCSKKVNGTKIASGFSFQLGHWSQWKTRHMESFPPVNSSCENWCTFKLLLIEQTFPLHVLLLFCCEMESVDFKTFETILISQCFIYTATYHYSCSYFCPDAEMIVLKHPRNSRHGVGTVPRKCTLAVIFCKSKNSLDVYIIVIIICIKSLLNSKISF